jgi:hypothetical protein
MFSRFLDHKIRTNPEISHTKYHFGDKAEIEDTELTLLERDGQGDCLCLAPENKGLVDVDHRDINQE